MYGIFAYIYYENQPTIGNMVYMDMWFLDIHIYISIYKHILYLYIVEYMKYITLTTGPFLLMPCVLRIPMISGSNQPKSSCDGDETLNEIYLL